MQAQKRLKFGAMAALVGLSACGPIPSYQTQWFAMPGRQPQDQGIAQHICKPIAEGAKAKAELDTNWPKDGDGGAYPYQFSQPADERLEAIGRAAMTECMAEQGWYPKRVCVANCSDE